MKIERDANAGKNAFTGYGEGYIEVNGSRVRASSLVNAREVLTPWGPESIAGLDAAHVQAILERKPEVVLIGSGGRFAFPEMRVLSPLKAAGIGVEVMDTPAACRTYNILLSEGRDVLAALVVENPKAETQESTEKISR